MSQRKPKTTSVVRLILLTVSLSSRALGAPALSTVDYNRDIRPILSENCFPCHDFDDKKRKAKLRLNVKESAYEERDGKFALKTADLKAS